MAQEENFDSVLEEEVLDDPEDFPGEEIEPEEETEEGQETGDGDEDLDDSEFDPGTDLED